MRFKSNASSQLRRAQLLAILTAMSACQPLVRKDGQGTGNRKSGPGGTLSLSEAVAPGNVSQIQIVLLDEARCKKPVPAAQFEPTQITMTTGSGAGTSSSSPALQLTGGHHQGRQSGGWYIIGMFGQSGILDQVLSKLFGLASLGSGNYTANVNITNNVTTTTTTNNYYNTPAPVAPTPEPAPAPLPAPAPEPTPAPAPVPPAPVHVDPVPAPAPSTDPGSTVNSTGGGYVPADPSCVVLNVQQPYKTSETLNFNNIPVGSYTLLVLWEDANGVPFQQGSSTVTITSSQVAVANIVMLPVTTGGISINVVNGASKLDFLGSLPIAAPGVCTAVKVQTQDDTNAPAPLAAVASLSFASSASTGGFHLDSACTDAAVSVAALSQGATDLTVYYKDSAAGAPTLSVTSPNASLAPASIVMGAVLEPAAAMATKMSWSVSPAAANSCAPLLILVQDAVGGQASFSELRLLNVRSSSATGTFYADATCSTSMTAFNLAVGASQASLYYKDSAAGTPVLTVMDPAAGGLGSATIQGTITK